MSEHRIAEGYCFDCQGGCILPLAEGNARAERSAGAAPLDVEVLAMAIRLSFGKWREFTPPTADMKMANTAAAEYARLSKGTDR